MTKIDYVDILSEFLNYCYKAVDKLVLNQNNKNKVLSIFSKSSENI